MRNRKIDCLRVVAVFLIVWLHSVYDNVYPTVFGQIGSLPVHFFFLLAGYFVYGKSDKKILKRVLYFGLVYFLANIFYVGVNCLILGQMPIDYVKRLLRVGIIKFLLQLFAFNTLIPSGTGGHLWYVSALIVAFLALIIVRRKFLIHFACVLYGIGLVLSRYVFPFLDITVSIYCFRNGIFEATPMVFLGYYLHSVKEKTDGIYNDKKKFFLLTALVIAFCYFSLTLSAKVLKICSDLSLRIVILSVALLFLALYPYKFETKFGSVVAFVGARLTLMIYIIHPIFIYFYAKIFNGFLITLMSFLSATLVSLVYFLVKKYVLSLMKAVAVRFKENES